MVLSVQEPIPVAPGVVVPVDALEVTAVRSPGPGGQNVNKVASKIQLRVDLDLIQGLDPASRARLDGLVRTKLDADGKLLVMSSRTRDQLVNLQDARDKVKELVARALVAPVPRRPTKPTRGSVRRRLEDKRRVGDKKVQRRVRGEE